MMLWMFLGMVVLLFLYFTPWSCTKHFLLASFLKMISRWQNSRYFFYKVVICMTHIAFQTHSFVFVLLLIEVSPLKLEHNGLWESSIMDYQSPLSKENSTQSEVLKYWPCLFSTTSRNFPKHSLVALRFSMLQKIFRKRTRRI